MIKRKYMVCGRERELTYNEIYLRNRLGIQLPRTLGIMQNQGKKYERGNLKEMHKMEDKEPSGDGEP